MEKMGKNQCFCFILPPWAIRMDVHTLVNTPCSKVKSFEEKKIYLAHMSGGQAQGSGLCGSTYTVT